MTAKSKIEIAQSGEVETSDSFDKKPKEKKSKRKCGQDAKYRTACEWLNPKVRPYPEYLGPASDIRKYHFHFCPDFAV